MSLFSEPDLNFALTAVCFIADERVFNYEDYPEDDPEDVDNYDIDLVFPKKKGRYVRK